MTIGSAKTTTSTRKARKPSPTAKTESFVAGVRKKLGVTRKVFSRLTGYSERAIANWESGDHPDEPALRRVRETERFQERLSEVVSRDEIPQWLEMPNK